MNLVEYPDREMMMMDLANCLAGDLKSILLHEERASLVVPGGTTPGPIFDVLCGVEMEWDRISILLSDERWVPEHSDRSNTRLLRERLLREHAARAEFLPLYAEADVPEDKLAELSEAIKGVLPVSVLLLGMGADMHTASLFPGADKLAEALAHDAPVLMPMRAPGAPEPRITLTAPVLAGALKTHIVITGAEKRAAVERAHSLNDVMKAPVSTVLSGATIHWAE